MCQTCVFVKFGFDYKGCQRLRCKVCGKTNRQRRLIVSAEKEHYTLHREKLSARACSL